MNSVIMYKNNTIFLANLYKKLEKCTIGLIMNIFKSVKKTSILYKYLAYYSVMFTIPLIILGSILYNNSVIILQKDLQDYNLQKVHQAQDIMDKQFQNIDEMAMKISFNQNLLPYVVQKNDYWAMNATVELNKYKTFNSSVDDILLYFRDNGNVYATDGNMSLDTMFNSDIKIRGSEQQKFLSLLNNTVFSKVEGYTGVPTLQGNSNHFMAYFLSLPPVRNTPYATIVFTMKQNTIEKLIGNIFGSLQGKFFILNKDGNVIFTMGDDSLVSFDQLKGIVSRKDFRQNASMKIGKRQYFVIDTSSPNTGWHYVAVMSKVDYLARVHQMKYQVILILSAVILVSFIAAYLLAARSYRPIKRLYDIIFAKNGTVKQNNLNKNEIENIESSINDTLEEYRNVAKQLSDQKPLIRERILEMLIQGALADKSKIGDLLSLYDIRLDRQYFYTVIISSFNQKNSTDFNERSIFLNEVLLKNFEKYEYYMLELISEDVVLLLNTNFEKTSKGFIYNLVRDLQEILDAELKEKANIGAGNIYEDSALINKSYIEALSVLDYNLIKGCVSLQLFSDMASSDGDVVWYPLEHQLRLEQCIKQGNIYIIREIVSEIIEVIRQKELSAGMTRSVCYGVVNSVIRLVNELESHSFTEDSELLAGFHSLDDLKIKLENTAFKICSYINNKKNSNNDELSTAILKYIDEHFCDSMINLDIIADHFNISYNYLSTFFKQQTGNGFADYLKKLRISHAKKLLMECETAVKDIVRQVGYNDTANFIRTFRLLEGLTPGEFRKLHSR